MTLMAKKNAKPSTGSPRLANKKARYQYEILERVEAGIALKGKIGRAHV